MILVTGAAGFVGSALVARLGRESPGAVRAAVRQSVWSPPSGVDVVAAPDLGQPADWSGPLAGVEVVVHAAARVHVMNASGSESLAAFRAVNRDGTLALAEQAAAARVRRFVFLSSVKVNGEETEPGQNFGPDDQPAPEDAYAVSKHEAEVALKQVARARGLEVVVVRAPLVHGPGVRANFASLVQAVRRGWPLPLGMVNNRRSLVARENLVDFLIACSRRPEAAGQTFMVSDGEDVSTADLLRRIGLAVGRPARLLPLPPPLLRALLAAAGRGDMARRLLGNLQVDISKNESLLGWRPPVTLNRALAALA